MYAKDISELRGHFDCKSCQLQQVQTQILQTERANREIQEDIDFVKKHSPLLEEKLKLEAEAVKDVLAAYEQVSRSSTKVSLTTVPPHTLSEDSSLLEVPKSALSVCTKTGNCVPTALQRGHSESREGNDVGL